MASRGSWLYFLFQYLIDGFRNCDLRGQVADLLGVTTAAYTSHQMTYDLRRLRLRGLIYRPEGTQRYFVTPHGWKVARLFSRLEVVSSGQLWPCSLPPTRSCHFPFGALWTVSMPNLTS